MIVTRTCEVGSITANSRADRGAWAVIYTADGAAARPREVPGAVLAAGRLGRLYYWIRQADLTAGRWDRTWLILQCG
jgi:hypothetical protein